MNWPTKQLGKAKEPPADLSAGRSRYGCFINEWKTNQIMDNAVTLENESKSFFSLPATLDYWGHASNSAKKK